MNTEQAHNNLRNVLTNGRTVLNGLPLSTNEGVILLQCEQMLYEKAVQLDKINQRAANEMKFANKENVPENGGKIAKLPANLLPNRKPPVNAPDGKK